MQLARIEKPQSSRPVAIDVDGEPKGIVVAHEQGLRFIAVKFDAFSVDGQVFATLDAVQDAVRAATRG